jgi:hypothetical protein
MLTHRLATRAIGPLVIATLLSAGCSGSTRHGNGGEPGATNTNAGATSMTAGAGNGGGAAATNAGAAGTGEDDQPPGPNAIDQLLACDVEEPCPRSGAQLAEASMRSYSKDSAKCVLEGLRDRKPGRYLHDIDSTTSGSSDGAEHVILVTDAGEVLHATKAYSFGPVATGAPVIAGSRCQLKPASYFEGCLSALAGNDAADADTAWQCVYGSGGVTPGPFPWFESCSSEIGLACE